MGKFDTKYNITMDTQKTTKQANYNRNPTGKGGFQDHPELRNPGGWKKEDSIGYQYNFLIRLKVNEFREWLQQHPENERTMAQELAYQAVLKARKELNYLKEVTDRIEGKAQQFTDITSKGKEILSPAIISTINPRDVISETKTEESS